VQFNVTEEQLFSPRSLPKFTHIIPNWQEKRTGPGEDGKSVRLDGAEGEEAERLQKKWFMNVLARFFFCNFFFMHFTTVCNTLFI
jgi:hypothetical protein